MLIYLVRLAEKCHVDLPAAVLHKMEQNKKKYPVSQVYGSSKKYTEYKLKDQQHDNVGNEQINEKHEQKLANQQCNGIQPVQEGKNS